MSREIKKIKKVYIIGVTGTMATAIAKEIQGKQIDAVIVDELNDLDKQECQETIKVKNIYVPPITECLYDPKPIYKNTPGCMPKKGGRKQKNRYNNRRYK